MQVQNIGLPVDHCGLNKFGTRNANYKSIFNKLREVITPVILQKQRSAKAQDLGKFA
jgi:hypothetical protein